MTRENKYINHPRNEQKDRFEGEERLFLTKINVKMFSSVCNRVAGTGPQP